MATFRTMKEIPETFECLVWQLIKLLSSDYKCVDIAAETYQKNSIKSKEKIEEMQVKHLLNQQIQKFHEVLLVFYQAMVTKQN